MPMSEGLRIAVFASGKGSNFKAILDAMDAGHIPGADVVLAISNNYTAGALEIARGRGIPTVHISRPQYASDAEYTEALLGLLRKHSVNFIVLAGYMKILDTRIIQSFRNRILNIHPALLPSFG